MPTSARLLRLLSLLQTPREWTGGELAERLGVSPRTIRHDVERLRDLGYPVHATRGPAGGYRLGAGAAMPPLLLDDAEAVAVVIGLRTTVGDAVSGVEEASLRALAKLEQVLPARLRSRVRTLSSVTVAVPPAAPASAVDPEVLTAVAVASHNHERVRFTYTGFDGAASEREVEPYRLVNWGRRWYLVGYDTGRSDWRTFRVDRVVLRTPGGGRFTPRPLPSANLAEWVSRRVSAAAWRYRARITVFAPAAVVQARTRGLAGTVTPVGDSACVLDTGSDDAATLAVYLGMLGCDFRVDEPPELAAAVRELAERYRRAAP
jgi:predicted DNA-binding transcriptional regulator YafY